MRGTTETIAIDGEGGSATAPLDPSTRHASTPTDAAPASRTGAEIAAQEVINGRYQLLELLGRGGMGSVYRALDRRLGRQVAIKVLRADRCDEAIDRKRIASEAAIAASLKHPAIAQVHDVGEVDADHRPFVVMELIRGVTLAQLLRERGPLDPAETSAVLRRIADALHHLHERGIVHRDLKPANIMLTTDGDIVIVDFGIALASISESLSTSGTLLGTVDYISPEQVEGSPATPASDLYALGVIAHQCLTGTSPFHRGTALATAYAQMHDPLPDLDDATPPGLRDLVPALGSKAPADRPADAAAVVTALEALGLPDQLPTVEAAEVPLAEPLWAGIAVPDTPPPSARRGRVRRWSALSGVALLVVVALNWGQTRGAEALTVPDDVVGMQVDAAFEELEEAGLDPQVRLVDRPATPQGLVVAQTPSGGQVDDGVVRLEVASGSVRVAADDLVGLSYLDAVARLEELGLSGQRRDVQRNATAEAVVAAERTGRVASARPWCSTSLSPPPAPGSPAPRRARRQNRLPAQRRRPRSPSPDRRQWAAV